MVDRLFDARQHRGDADADLGLPQLRQADGASLPARVGEAENGFLHADVVDVHPQVAVPIDGVQAEVKVRIEEQHRRDPTAGRGL